jgi:hypothetical protein
LSTKDDETKAQQVSYNLVLDMYFHSTKESRKISTQKMRYSLHKMVPHHLPSSHTNSRKYSNPQYRRTIQPTLVDHLVGPKGSCTIHTAVAPRDTNCRRTSTPTTGRRQANDNPLLYYRLASSVVEACRSTNDRPSARPASTTTKLVIRREARRGRK